MQDFTALTKISFYASSIDAPIRFCSVLNSKHVEEIIIKQQEVHYTI